MAGILGGKAGTRTTSTASWRRGRRRISSPANPGASLKVTTTRLRPGYLRKNGVPYSASTSLTEYYDRFSEPNGDEWFTVTTIVTDPVYLAIPFVTTTDFKKEVDASRWNPVPCSAR